VIGKGGHGGSPHRAKNASELLIPVLEELMGVVPGLTGKGSIGFDMRLIPEGSAEEAYLRLERWFTAQKERHLPCARLISPEARRKQGYAIPLDDPDLGFLVGAVEAVTGERPKIVGEYGGTDASSFRDLVNREGKPLRALMYGSITSDSRPHDYDENADPLLIRRVTDIIVWMAKNWDKRRA
jgi:acetylornithine deacetylase/succinyl-diaminopimelate desuccinylase-like protein